MYIHEHKNWPHFVWNQEQINHLLIRLRFQQGNLIGAMEAIGFHSRKESILQTLTQDVVKSSEIEGEVLDYSLVRSSVARHLGKERAGLSLIDRNVEGVVEMVLDATQKFDQSLNKERLFSWHTSLFLTEHRDALKIQVGAWRRGPVQVVSGRMGNEKIHFEAPSADNVAQEMAAFLDWLNHENKIDLVLKAGLAHLWFLTIHPFEDGNGRIGRAIVDLLLARSEKSSCRFYSLSSQIQKERKGYYAILEHVQKGALDVTLWLEWFLRCLEKAIENATMSLERILFKAKFWDTHSHVVLNDRQRKMINLLLDDFEGKLTSSKWAKIAKCSQDSAYRDILDLIEKEVLVKNMQGGRSTSYTLAK